MNKEYIGDSVYIDFDGYSFILITDNRFGASNTIILNLSHIEKIQEYVANTINIYTKQQKESEDAKTND